jgi:hypothetical protein
MGLFNKKSSDPISARSRELNAQINALESKIKELSDNIDHQKVHPKVRSTSYPDAQNLSKPAAVAPREPIFERVEPAKPATEYENSESHFNEFGVRKYDLLGAFRRMRRYFGGEPATNPKLVSYLAAGSIKGLRPLRYEKRIARNRFIFLSIFFVFILWGILAIVFNYR